MNLDGYTTVPQRLRMALDAHPDLRITEGAVDVVTIGGDTFVSVTVTVHRNPDDPLPTSATAWEPYPGRTPYTRGSEMMNASTSALGRALGLMGYGTANSFASAEEVQARRDDPPATKRPTATPTASKSVTEASTPQLTKISALLFELGINTREDKLARVEAIVGRPLTTSKELTKAEAGQVIDVLEADAVPVRTAADHQAELEASIARLTEMAARVEVTRE